VSSIKQKVIGVRQGFSDHSDNFTMFKVKVEESNLGNHHIATIETAGKVFEARHRSRSQAIADVNRVVREAHKRGEIYPGRH
jgi:hypothetical protein